MREALGTLIPTPYDLAPWSTHQPHFRVSAPAAAVGVFAGSAQNARPGACEDTPRERPRPGRSPAYGRPGLDKSQPV